jgi:LuxR family glucitol operon transcriptional activator
MRSEKFGRLLKGAIGSIVAHEGKTAPVIEEELGQQMGLSPASIQRYKAGHIPPDSRNLEILAAAAVRRGYLNGQWLAEFLQAAHYASPTPLLDRLYPFVPEASAPGKNATGRANLPAPTYGKFIERPQAYADVIEGLQQRSAVVLLVSLGGMGKTSLAREIAGDCLAGHLTNPWFRAVVWVSDQAHPGATTLNTVLDEIALTLDYPGLVRAEFIAKRREVENLLRRQAVLLVVDNFETITDQTLPDWLVRLPEPSKALVTSRENLGKFRRSSWPVELEGLGREEAWRFLQEKMVSLKMGQLVKDLNRLDPLITLTGGNPKALELALGQLKYGHQTLAQVTVSLEAARGEIFDNLFRRNWANLGEAARSVYAALPLFSDPARAESLAATAGVSLSGVEQTLENLSGMGLVDLQRAALDEPPRYSLHPLSRAFAQARLAENPEFESLARQQQLEWYSGLAGKVGYAWDDLNRLEILDAEQETLQKVILWAASTHRNSLLLELIRGVDYYYYIRGSWRGQPDLGYLRIEAAAGSGDTLEEIKALALYIQALCRQERLDAVSPFLKRLADLGSTLALPDETLFEVQYTLGLDAMARQEYAEAANIWQDSLELARKTSARAFAVARGYQAICYYRQGQTQAAESLWQGILADTGTGGFLRGAISSRIGLARLRLDRPEPDAARPLLDEAAQLANEYQDRERSAEIAGLYARYFLLRGDVVSARQFAARARDIFERLGRQTELAEIRHFLASLEDGATGYD